MIAAAAASAVARRLAETSALRPTRPFELQQCRGIRAWVKNGSLEGALTFLQRQMQGSGMERLIKAKQRFHLKNSEKRVLARKNLERKIRSQDLARKLQTILLKKARLGFEW
ncbi:hypothetical protein MLD38_001286 [Melastoma candidum]|uniref:Uncharacterized protein n=1 Tax=Melastoma candidum TaxID=119954 RepID=A0ACB9SLE4_9MYRT|nr:hypothetical protein MLD38_001286 [Melastoma candidum]